MPDDADHLAGRHGEADVVENQAAAVAERHAVELDFAAHLFDGDRILRLDDAGHTVEDFEEALGRGRRALGGGQHAAHAFHAGVEATDVRDERRQNTDRDLVKQDLARAHPPHHQQAHLIE